MSRIIIIIAFLFYGFPAFAQQTGKGLPNPATKPPSKEIDYHAKGAPIPEILLTTLDSIRERSTGGWFKKKKWGKLYPKLVTLNDLRNNANLFVMIFNPGCGHCEDQTDLLEKNSSLFKKTKLVMVANKVMRPYLPDFIRIHHINDYPEIILGMDSTGFIAKTTLYSALPPDQYIWA